MQDRRPDPLQFADAEIRELRGLVEDLPEEAWPFQQEFHDWAWDGGQAVLDACTALVESSESPTREQAVVAVAAVQAFAARAESLAASVTGTATLTKPNWWNTIKQKIGSIASQVWSVVSHLMTVKQWKLTGSLGGGVLGLTGVAVEITFG
jgi:predicted alpha/beta hydrolase